MNKKIKLIEQENLLIEDKVEALKLVKASGKEINKVSQNLRDDEDVILKAALNDYIALQYASERLKNNRQFISKIIDNARNNIPKLLTNLPSEFKNDKELMLRLINKEKEGKVINYVSEELKNDYDIVSETVKMNGVSIVYASDNLKRNKELALLAVKNKGYALQFIYEKLQSDKDVVVAAVKNYGESLKYASEDLREDKEVVLAAVAHNGYALKYASENLKNDLEVALESYKSAKGSVQYFSKEIKRKINGKQVEPYLKSLIVKESLESEIEMTPKTGLSKRPKL